MKKYLVILFLLLTTSAFAEELYSEVKLKSNNKPINVYVISADKDSLAYKDKDQNITISMYV